MMRFFFFLQIMFINENALFNCFLTILRLIVVFQIVEINYTEARESCLETDIIVKGGVHMRKISPAKQAVSVCRDLGSITNSYKKSSNCHLKNELTRLTGISLCLAEILAKWAVFSRMTAPVRLTGLQN